MMKTLKQNIPFIVIALLYICLTFFSPIDQTALEKYELTVVSLNIIRVTFVLPILLIWYFLQNGVYQSFLYYVAVAKTKEGCAYKYLFYGLLALFLGFLVPTFINFFTTYNLHNAAIERTVSITNTYIGVASYMISFWFFFAAGQHLLKTIKKKSEYVIPLVVSAVVSIFYLFLFFSNEYRAVSSNPDINATYYLKDMITIPTIVLPNIISWFVGLVAAQSFRLYAKNVAGILYNAAFKSISTGLWVVVCVSIISQILAQMGVLFEDASLSVILWIVYIFLAIIAYGYYRVAKGAKTLGKIEDAV